MIHIPIQNAEAYIEGMKTLITWYKEAMVLGINLIQYKSINNKHCPLCIVADSNCINNCCPWIVLTGSFCYIAGPDHHTTMSKSDPESILNRISQLELWIEVYNGQTSNDVGR